MNGPSAASELRRAFNAHNLGVAALAAVAVGGGLAGLDEGLLAAQATVAAFTLITLMHAALHAWFGWRLGRGLRALAQGNTARACALLGILDRPGAAHYDPHGHARTALAQARLRAAAGPKTGQATL